MTLEDGLAQASLSINPMYTMIPLDLLYLVYLMLHEPIYSCAESLASGTLAPSPHLIGHIVIHACKDRQTDKKAGRQAGRKASKQVGRQIDRKTGGQLDRQTQTEKQRQGQADNQTHRQIGKKTDKQTSNPKQIMLLKPKQYEHQ